MRNIVEYYNEKRIFLHQTLAYMLFFVFALIITGILYTASFGALKDYAVESALSLLGQSRDSVDAQLNDIDNITDYIAKDYNIQSFLSVSKPLKDEDYDRIRDMFDKLPYNYSDSELIEYLFVYFPNSDVIVSPGFASGRIENIYNYYFNYDGMQWMEWKQKLLDDYNYISMWDPHSISAEGNEFSGITYIKSIVSLYNANKEGYVIALIDESDLINILDNSLIQNGGISYILDAQDDMIAFIDNSGIDKIDIPRENIEGSGYLEISTDAGDMLVVYTESEYNSWSYVSVIPLNSLMGKVNTITMTFIIIVISGLIISIFIAVVIASHNSRHIQGVIRALGNFLGKEAPRGNEYDFISGTVTNLISMNENLRKDMRRQNVLIQNLFFDRLLHNRFANSEEMHQHMENAKIKLTANQYQVLLIKISGYYGQITKEMLDELSEVRVLVLNILIERINNLGHFHQVDESNISIILTLNSNINTRKLINTLQEELIKYNIVVSFGVGRKYSEIGDIWKSYTQSVRALESIGESDDNIRIYDEMKINTAEYYYPIQVESRLSTLVKLGEKPEVKAIIESLKKENFKCRRITQGRLRLLMSELLGTIAKLKDEVIPTEDSNRGEIENEIHSILEMQPNEGAFERAGDVLARLTDYVLKLREGRNSRLRDEMLSFINENYMDSNLCLYSVAVKFNLAEKYFSRFFKEQTGHNFSSYLEKIRMDSAKGLLGANKLTINEIAHQVGYVNINTFYKAFKRVHGTSPRAFGKK
jgi:AraC-like DNA-binding protein